MDIPQNCRRRSLPSSFALAGTDQVEDVGEEESREVVVNCGLPETCALLTG